MNNSHPVDVHVGKRLRQHRMLLGLSLHTLAENIGVKYQQVQRYETGVNRISASRLFELARVLDVPVGYFFQGLTGEDSRASESGSEPGKNHTLQKFLKSRQYFELNRNFLQIRDAALRRSIINLVRSLASQNEGD